jgi:hypothetical protein
MAATKLPERAQRLVNTFTDPRMRELASELWEHAQRNARDPKTLAAAAAEEKRKWKDSLEHLHRVCTRALNGDLGSENREIARRMLITPEGARRTDEDTMRRALAQFRKRK